MPKRAKYLIAFSLLLYGAFLVQRIALATGSSLLEGMGIAAVTLLVSAGLFLFLVRLVDVAAKRWNSRWLRPPATVLLLTCVLGSIGVASVLVKRQRESRDRQEREAEAESERERAALVEQVARLAPIRESGGTYYFGSQMTGEDGLDIDWPDRTPQNSSSQVHCIIFRGDFVSDAALDVVAALPELRRLDAANAWMSESDFQRIDGMNHLKSLTLRRSLNTEGLRFVASCKDLVELDISGTKVSDDSLKCIENMRVLKRLRLTHNPITDKGMEHLATLTELQALSLDCTKIKGVGMRHLIGLVNLQKLSLDFTDVTDAGVSCISSLAHLRYLSLGFTRITDTGVAELQKALPNCKISR